MSLPADEIREDRVAIYIRWSTEDQGEGTTLEVQTEACRSYILSQGWTCRDDLVFVDDGISGASMERPALTRLRGLVRRGQVDCVVVYKLDRLSRSVLDMLKLVMEEWDGVCAVKSAREPIDTMTPTGKMFFYQLMSFAEWERSVIKERMFAGRLRRAHQGKIPGFVLPFGYRKGESGAVAVDPAAAAVVARIYRLYLGGLGCRAISKALDREGLASPTGGKWTEGSLMRVLTNPAYMGTFIYGKQQKVKGGRKVAAKQPHLVKEGFYPAIVGREVFEEVQRLRKERPGVGRSQGTGRSLGSQSLLSGLVRCRCGRACAGIGFDARGRSYRYYACGAAQGTGAHICDAGNIRQELLDHLVVEKLLALFAGADGWRRVLENLAAEARAAHERGGIARQAAEQEVRKAEETERRLRGLFLDERLSLEEYRPLQAELNVRRAEARSELQKAMAAEAEALAAMTQRSQNTVLLARIGEWGALERVEQKQLLRQFISTIVAYRDRQASEISIEVRWRLGAPGTEAVRYVVTQEKDYTSVRRFAEGRERVGGRFTPVRE